MCIRTNQQPSTTQARLGQLCACATQSNKRKTRLNYSVEQQKLDHAPSARVQLQIGTTECSTQNNNILQNLLNKDLKNYYGAELSPTLNFANSQKISKSNFFKSKRE